jgi:hypothetical protein
MYSIVNGVLSWSWSYVVGFTTTCATSVYHHWSCEFEPRSWRGVLDTTLCDKVCQWLATCRWFSSGTPVFSINKSDRHDITVPLNNWIHGVHNEQWLHAYVRKVNATFNNISVISWRSDLLMEKTGVPEENQRHVASHWQTLSHNAFLTYACNHCSLWTPCIQLFNGVLEYIFKALRNH